jgi:hypothetical protein
MLNTIGLKYLHTLKMLYISVLCSRYFNDWITLKKTHTKLQRKWLQDGQT